MHSTTFKNSKINTIQLLLGNKKWTWLDVLGIHKAKTKAKTTQEYSNGDKRHVSWLSGENAKQELNPLLKEF